MISEENKPIITLSVMPRTKSGTMTLRDWPVTAAISAQSRQAAPRPERNEYAPLDECGQ